MSSQPEYHPSPKSQIATMSSQPEYQPLAKVTNHYDEQHALSLMTISSENKPIETDPTENPQRGSVCIFVKESQVSIEFLMLRSQ